MWVYTQCGHWKVLTCQTCNFGWTDSLLTCFKVNWWVVMWLVTCFSQVAHLFENPYRNSSGKMCFSENVKEAIFFTFFIHICLCLNRSRFTMCLLWINPTFHPPYNVFSTSPKPRRGGRYGGVKHLGTWDVERCDVGSTAIGFEDEELKARFPKYLEIWRSLGEISDDLDRM